MKRIFALALSALLALSVFAGCSLSPQSAGPTAPVVKDIDRDAVIATVGDFKVTMGEFADLFDTYASYYVNYGYDIFADPTALQEVQDQVADMLVQEKIVAYQAQQAGFSELSGEDLQKAEAQAAEELQSLLETYRPQAEEEAANDPAVDVEARTKELVEAQSEYLVGEAMSFAELEAFIQNFYKENAVNELFREEVLKGVTVTDEAVQDWYDTSLKEQQDAYAENGGAYKDDQETFEKYGGMPVVFIPEGYSRVLHILIAPEEQPGEEYLSKMDEMDELAAEYGELAFEAAIDGKENPRLAEIVTSYKKLEQEAKALEDKRMAPAVATASQLYSKLEAGEDFKTLMSENTQDNAILSFETIAQKGLLISNQYESEADWSKAVKTAFSTLQQGQYSQVVQDEEGCHILYYLSDEPAGPVALDTVKAAISELLLADLREEEWASMMETWKNDGSVKLNQDLIHSYGAPEG